MDHQEAFWSSSRTLWTHPVRSALTVVEVQLGRPEGESREQPPPFTDRQVRRLEERNRLPHERVYRAERALTRFRRRAPHELRILPYIRSLLLHQVIGAFSEQGSFLDSAGTTELSSR